MRRVLAYGGFCLLDHFIWLLIQLLPGHALIGLARKRPWQRFQLSLPPLLKQQLEARICWLLRTRCRNAGWSSTCLSRSLSGRVLFDLIGVANELHLGMSKLSDGRKVPHAWLMDPSNGRTFTPGLIPRAGVPLTVL